MKRAMRGVAEMLFALEAKAYRAAAWLCEKRTKIELRFDLRWRGHIHDYGDDEIF